MKIHLKVWRQRDAQSKGNFIDYRMNQINQDMSFLEMLDTLNIQLVKKENLPSNLTMIAEKESVDNVA